MIMKQGISENCQQLVMCVCAQRRHLHVQSSRFATELNVVAVLDLKECKKGKIWNFHLLDAATKFTLSALIYKFLFIPSTIIDKIMTLWIVSGFRIPKK